MDDDKTVDENDDDVDDDVVVACSCWCRRDGDDGWTPAKASATTSKAHVVDNQNKGFLQNEFIPLYGEYL
jgi:hypothetical protein